MQPINVGKYNSTEKPTSTIDLLGIASITPYRIPLEIVEFGKTQ